LIRVGVILYYISVIFFRHSVVAISKVMRTVKLAPSQF